MGEEEEEEVRGSVEEIAENVCPQRMVNRIYRSVTYSRVCVRICAAKFAHIVEFLRRISRIIFRTTGGQLSLSVVANSSSDFLFHREI